MQSGLLPGFISVQEKPRLGTLFFSTVTQRGLAIITTPTGCATSFHS